MKTIIFLVVLAQAALVGGMVIWEVPKLPFFQFGAGMILISFSMAIFRDIVNRLVKYKWKKEEKK